ncbi:hypothetical protein BD414DRAFT_534875 [Trametes punicea]|nr:hypothetical protein BD414DRAFT_534875 [Trametes punicea]
MEGNKRKRDSEGTVVTFYAPDKTFQRVYKGQSLEETKAIVRKKLGLANDASVRFSRLHEGRHIDLEDEEDFEAFQHLARQVSSLDVSVFVGSARPSTFSQLSTVQASSNHVVSKKRRKNKRAALRPDTVVSEAATQSPPASVPTSGPSASTLDANSVPKKKRKRNEEVQSREKDASSERPPILEVNGSGGEDSSRKEPPAAPSKPPQKARKEGTNTSNSATRLTARGPSSSSHPPAVLEEQSTVPIGSKRKRQESPEAFAASSSRLHVPLSKAAPAPCPPSSSSPVKKKRKREKHTQIMVEPAVASESLSVESAKPGKKGKRKADHATIPDMLTEPAELRATGLRESDAADVEDNVGPERVPRKAQVDKKNQKADPEVAHDDPADAADLPVKPHKKKRRDNVAEVASEASTVTAPTAGFSEAVSAAIREKKREKRRTEEPGSKVVSASPPLSSPAPAAPAESPTPANMPSQQSKSKQDKRNKILRPNSIEDASATSQPAVEILTREESVPISSSAPQSMEATPKLSYTEKKRKRKKMLAADTTVEPDTSLSSTVVPESNVTQTEVPPSSTPGDESTPSKKRDRKKTVAPMQAAVQAIMSRNKPLSATAPPTQAPASEPHPETPLPSRKRNATKSKLRQAWGPEDIAGNDHSSTPITAAGAETVKVVNGESSAPPCPICNEASVHPRSKCPIIQGDPEYVRKRIAELKKSGRHEKLVDELEVLLKETQRRRKSAGIVPAPIHISPLGTTSDEATSPAVIPSDAASSGPRSVSTSAPSSARPVLPRVHAGSEISEVAVESKDEGSSNESSSEEEDNSDQSANAASLSIVPISMSAAELASVDVEALLRGPIKPRGSILNQILSESPTEGEQSSDVDDDSATPEEDLDSSEEEKNDRAFRRLSRKLEREAPSSSDDEREPELGNADMDVDTDAGDALVPPTIMDADPNDTVGQEPEEEVDVPVSARVEPEEALNEGESSIENAPPGAITKSPTEERSDQGYESDAEDLAPPLPPPETRPRKEFEPNIVEQELEGAKERQKEEKSGRDALSADRGDDSPVARTAAVDGPVVLQKPATRRDSGPSELSNPADTGHVEERAAFASWNGIAGEETSDGSGEGTPERLEVAHASSETGEDDHDKEKEGEDGEASDAAPTAFTARERSPELGAPEQPAPESGRNPTPSPPPPRLPGPAVEDADKATSTSSAANVSLDLRPDHDVSVPIESLGSFADVSERHAVLDEDPIEDADAEPERAQVTGQESHQGTQRPPAEEVGIRADTPPPAMHRTPGTVSRMKDRYGRLSKKTSQLPSLSEQLLGSLASSQSQPDVEMRTEDDEQEQDEAEEEREQQGDEREAQATSLPGEPTPESESRAQQAEAEQDTRSRRTTRATTGGTSAMLPAVSITEPTAPSPAPTPATNAEPVQAPKRRAGRLTAEEKAAREAEKKAERERKAAEKKAERERKAEKRKAEKEAKDAARRAEKEAKEAARLAEREAREAAKRTAKEEKEKEQNQDRDGPKRGETRTRRARGSAAKPVSTRSGPSAIAVTQEGAAEDELTQDEGEKSSGPTVASSTPGVSKISWATLPAAQPSTQSEGVEVESSMIDELQRSSPDRATPRASGSPGLVSTHTSNTETDEADVSREVTITHERSGDQSGSEDSEGVPATTPRPQVRQKEPLFIPSSSQFPNTPFPEDGLPESTPYANGAANGHESGSENEAGEDGADGPEGEDVFKAPQPRPKALWMGNAPYRRLSDIASQQLFAGSPVPSQALLPPSQSLTRRPSVFDRDDEDDEDEDDEESSSGSDSEALAKKSHIPQERRAGVGMQRKKKSSLLSSFG